MSLRGSGCSSPHLAPRTASRQIKAAREQFSGATREQSISGLVGLPWQPSRALGLVGRSLEKCLAPHFLQDLVGDFRRPPRQRPIRTLAVARTETVIVINGHTDGQTDSDNIYIYIYIYIYSYIYVVALIAQWLGCQPHEAEVLGSILTTSN